MSSPPTPTLRLSFIPSIFCAGSSVEGQVLLDFRQLQQDNIEQVQIILRGALQTSVHHDDKSHHNDKPYHNISHDETHSVSLVNSTTSLWSKGAQYPPPGTDILHLPFSLSLPPDLPPSFHYRGFHKSAFVRYSLTVVGVRPGTFRPNTRLHIPIVIIQKDELGALLRSELGSVEWRRVRKEEKIRKGLGLWGQCATVRVELSLPKISAFPLFSEIPYTIEVVTTTAPLTRAKADAHSPDKSIFPAPPVAYSQISFKLFRTLEIYANRQSSSSETDVAQFLGEHVAAQVDIDLPEKEWIVAQGGASEREEKGKWVQRSILQSKMKLNVPPTFSVDTLRCRYFLWLKVPFSGFGNDMILQLPITVSSGIDAPVPRVQSHWAQSNTLQSSQPRTLDLPPAYWNETDREWGDADNRK